MRTIDCVTATARLSAWIDGELEESEASAVVAHVAGCSACARRRALLAGVGSAMRSLSTDGVSAGFDETLRERLAASVRPAPHRRLAVVAASLAAALILGWWLRPTGPAAPAGSVRSAPGPMALRVAIAPALDCVLGTTGGRCRVEMPCASAAACGSTVAGESSAMARDARPLAAGAAAGLP